jgi:23S rRNA pseudouridine2605 synthase
MLDKIKTKPVAVKRKGRTSFDITLYEGRKHQIRRMCDACRLTIESLVRVGIGELTISFMKPGNTRKLTPKEIAELKSR